MAEPRITAGARTTPGRSDAAVRRRDELDVLAAVWDRLSPALHALDAGGRTLYEMPAAIKPRLRDALAVVVEKWLGLAWQLRRRSPPRRSPLPVPLVVSLTSYPPRFPSLDLTLKSLLLQTIRPDHLELWVAEADLPRLPQAVRGLVPEGLTIRTCSDTRSYKKIIPALATHADAVIVTADDDAYYWPTWLEELAAAVDLGKREVLCHRAHRIVLGADGLPVRYNDWQHNMRVNAASLLTFPTGLGGILYPPGILGDGVDREDLFLQYCPSGDDIWLYWMASLNGASFRKIGPIKRFVTWRNSQEVALYNDNAASQDINDQQIGRMIEAFGFPARAG